MEQSALAQQLRQESGVSAGLAAESFERFSDWLSHHQDCQLRWLAHSVQWALRSRRFQAGLELWLQQASAGDLCDWFAWVYDHSEHQQASQVHAAQQWWRERA